MINNLRVFSMELDELEKFKMKRNDLDYMGEGLLAPITNKQRNCIYGILNKIDKEPEDYGVDSVSDMTLGEAKELIDQLMDDQDEYNQNRNGSGSFNLF